MSTYSKLKFSASINGRQIKVSSTTTPGTLIHQAVNSLINMDEIWLYVMNNHTADVLVTIEFGGTTSPDDIVQLTVPNKSGLYLVIPGLILNNDLSVRIFASVSNVISVSGWVNRISE